MQQKDLNDLQADVTLELIKSFASTSITAQERILFLKIKYDEAKKRKEKDRSQEDQLVIKEYEANIARYTDDVARYNIHIENLNQLHEGFRSNKPVRV